MTAHFPSFYDAYRKRRSVIITLKMKKKLTPFLPFVPRLIAIFQRRTKGWGKKFFCFYTNLARTNHGPRNIRNNISPPLLPFTPSDFYFNFFFLFFTIGSRLCPSFVGVWQQKNFRRIEGTEDSLLEMTSSCPCVADSSFKLR